MFIKQTTSSFTKCSAISGSIGAVIESNKVGIDPSAR